ncbi:hypothetical protein MML48_9g00016571 [Holotrichia oblita]|uniref:Uncharacterized protein n=1 Tax=Holotrichia oblita TaxID=644536 RepID=A0ACB9SJD9_HOLOL|nr:hypothetical protein MML48_9g00016571 [Holotrichia oblita]
MSRTRIWALGILLVLYLVGVLLLSAVTLHEPKGNAFSTKISEYSQQISRSKHLEYGVSALRPPLRRSKIQWCTELRLLEPPQEPVALASFPGSGNTWLRYLLQQATGCASLCIPSINEKKFISDKQITFQSVVAGIYTGSVYKDYGLLKNGFPAESVINGSVLVVKTHEYGPLARKPFSKAILLVRAPAPAIQAEFNRQSGGHIGFASLERYKRNRGKYWQQFVNDKLTSWRQTNLDWLRNFTGPTHVIFYEQLVQNVENTVRTILDFLELPISDELFQCALARKEGIYRRKRRALAFDPFTSEMKRRMDKEQQRVYEEIYNVALPAKRRR